MYRKHTAFNGRPIVVSDPWNQSAKNGFVRVHFPPKTVHSPGAPVSHPSSAALAIACTFSCHLSSTLQRSKLNSDVDISHSGAFLRHTSLSAGGTAHRRERREFGDVATMQQLD